jgi:hypothetical protein
MSSDHYEDRDLDLLFGRKRPSDDSAGTPLSDSDHRQLEQMQELASRLGDDTAFYPDESQIDRLVGQVDERISSLEAVKTTRVPWFRYVAAAAAIVLLFGVFLMEQLSERAEFDYESANWSYELLLAESEYPEAAALVLGDEQLTFDDDEIDVLLHEYSTDGHFNAGEMLLDDLSEEELQYLEENFDIGDILL